MASERVRSPIILVAIFDWQLAGYERGAALVAVFEHVQQFTPLRRSICESG